MASCYTCEQTASEDLPERERVVEHGGWRVAHAFNSALAGWLVVVPLRHVESIGELNEAELNALGPLLGRLALALERVTACEKCYVVQFAEAEGFRHTHFHVIPRARDLDPSLLGPRIFEMLKRPQTDQVSPEEQDRIALAVRRELPADYVKA